ncbi:MAG: hypothetical protein HYV60_03985 [Planctomycetia bacterium]|nr:hypothetical protein [Planctomycetia bacterium]
MNDRLAKTILVALAAIPLLVAPLVAQTSAEKSAKSQPTEFIPEPPLADKTLVVWVAPSNLTQRGGSALTIEDGSDHFDGIVFGELAPAKWMAGSDTFSRTQKDQANFPAEAVEGTTFVQLAIVYGREVS